MSERRQGVPEVVGVIAGDNRFPVNHDLSAKFSARADGQLWTSAPNGNPLRSAEGGRWYVVYSQPNREFYAQKQLAAQGFQTFLPHFRKTRRHARRLSTVNAPFFNRYLFVSLDLNRDRWRSIYGTFGVSSLISDGAFPLAVPSGVVESLLGVSDEKGLMNLGDALQIGEHVRVLNGPFADLVGELVRLDGARRARVLLHLLGGSVAVSLDRGDLASARAA